MLKDLLKFVDIKDGKEEDLKNYLEGLSVTPEGVKEYLDSEDGKKLLQPILDKYHTKSLESWKANNLDKITQEAVDQAIKEKYPDETDDQKRLKALEQELDNEKKARNRELLRNKAISTATEKGLPIDVIDHFLGDDEDSTLANIAKFEDVWKQGTQAAVEGVFKDGGRRVGKSDGSPKTYTREDVKQMSRDEINENWEDISKAMPNW